LRQRQCVQARELSCRKKDWCRTYVTGRWWPREFCRAACCCCCMLARSASASMPGVEACRYRWDGGVMRASCGDPSGCGVLVALWTALAPFVRWPYPGEGIFWCARWSCGDDVICWLSPEGVLEGICWRAVRLPGECAASTDGEAWLGGGGGVCAGESDGDNSELMSMATATSTVPSSCF
jgi:hypothetical protein